MSEIRPVPAWRMHCDECGYDGAAARETEAEAEEDARVHDRWVHEA